MSSVKEQYFEILNNGANLTTLCELTARLTDLPVAMTIPTRTIIARSSSYDDSLVHEYTSSLLLCSEEEIREQTESLERTILCKKASVAVLPYLSHKRINCGCFYEGKLIGVLDCPVVKTIDIRTALDTISLASKVFTTALLINGYISPAHTEPMQTYLISLLKGEVSDAYQQKKVYRSVLERIHEWRLIIVNSDSVEKDEKVLHKIHSFVSRTEDVWSIEFRGDVVMLFSENAYQTEFELLLEDFGSSGPLYISDSFSNILNASEQYEMCVSTQKFAKAEGHTDQIIYVKNYKMLFSFLCFSQGHNKKIFKNMWPERIRAYDNEHGTEYFETIKAYLLCKQNIASIAQHMNIHKNTVGYRLQRIEELFHLDLKDCRVITDLYLSMMRVLVFDD